MQYPSLFKPFMLLTGATIILIGMHWASGFLVPVMLGAFFATLLTPLYRWLKRMRVPGGLGLLISIIFMIAIAVFLVLLIGNSMTVMASELGNYTDQFSQRQAELAAQVENLGPASNLKSFVSSFKPGTVT